MAENSAIEWCDRECSRCRVRKVADAFLRDRSRPSGRAFVCKACQSTGKPKGWHGEPNVNPEAGRPGPAPKVARDGDRKQARQRVNVEVRTGRRPHPNNLPCTDCGHLWAKGERRHEYDHHRGYGSEHHLDVEPVCTTCHAARERCRYG